MVEVRVRAAFALVAVVGGVLPVTAQALPRAERPRPSVVVAVADTGVNPYHEVYRRPANTAHPCTWVSGFTDCSVPALRLTLGMHADWTKAVEADRAVWDAVQPGRWYWIPGTNIIGAACSQHRGAEPGAADPTCILDDHGHGTGSTSSVLAEVPEALLLVHDGQSDAEHLGRAPVVPDVQSHSWAPAAPLPQHAADPVTGPDALCSSPRAFQESLFFLAAGNEAPWPSGLDCERHRAEVDVVGGSYPGHWNYDSWTMYDFASWMCRPVARHDSVAAQEPRMCGTSFAAPTAAGAAAQALLRLRQQDRYAGRSTRDLVSRTVTRQAFRQALRDAATYAPEARYPGPTEGECAYGWCMKGWAPLPEQAAPLFWGYGWLDGTVSEAVVSCARRRACPAKPEAAQSWNATRHEVARLTDQRLVEPAPQDDAGSGRDAGRDLAGAVPVAAGKDYEAAVEPYGPGGDAEDAFRFRARGGQRLTVTASSGDVPQDAGVLIGCWAVLDAAGNAVYAYDTHGVWTRGCGNPAAAPPPVDAELPRDGTYVLRYVAQNGLPPHDYRFRLTLTG